MIVGNRRRSPSALRIRLTSNFPRRWQRWHTARVRTSLVVGLSQESGMRSRHALVLGALAGALVISLGSSDVARAGGDANAGKEKAVACQACHMAPAGSPGDTPHLAGQREGY